MAKRISVEARLLEWIDTAPIEVVKSIMTIAVMRTKARVTAATPGAPAPRVVKKRAARKTNAHAAVPSQATVFPGEGVTGASA